MSEIKKAKILYSNMWIGFTEEKRNIAGAWRKWKFNHVVSRNVTNGIL